MKYLAIYPAAIVWAALTIAAALPAAAHDHGLTCHLHASTIKDRIWIFSGANTSIESVEHNFENLLAAESSAFPAADLAAADRGLSDLGGTVEAVYLLVVRAERIADPAAAEEAIELARSVYEALPVARHVGFESFEAERRQGGAVVLPIEAVSAYLVREAGVSPELAAVFELAAESC